MTICVGIETNGMTDRRVYFDANAFIYAIESKDGVSAQLQTLFVALKRGVAIGVTSEFTLAEVLPKASPVQRRDYLDLIIFSRLFDLRPVSRDILIETADYRKHLSRPSYDTRSSMPKLPDAIHVITASNAKCDVFVSFDRGMRLPKGMQRVGREDERLSRLIKELS